MINATESFLRSSEVHRLFIQELVQGTFAEATSDTLRINAVRELIESELLTMLAENREALLDRLSAKLIESAKGNSEMARQAADEGLGEVQRLLANHAEAL